MSYASNIYEVPWNSDRWELALLERPDIRFMGSRGNWVLYRPRRVIITPGALDDPRVREAVRRAGAERCDEPVADMAAELGLEILLAPEDRQVELVRELNGLDCCSASLDHVQLPGPHRIHGDSNPLPASDPGDFPPDNSAGEGLTVLVLDTGCAPSSALGLTVGSADEEVVDEDSDGFRDPAAGHGTHVAGIIRRIAPAATVVPRRLLTGPVGEASDIDIAYALKFNGGANIINCSFGEMTDQDLPPLAIKTALDELDPEVVVVASSGNGGVSRVNWPAAFERVVAVGAVGIPETASDWQQTDFSNHGSWVDCCAPGVGIVSTFLTLVNEGFDSGYASWTGTSMAAPAVAGTIAKLATTGMDLEGAVAHVKSQPTLGTIGSLVIPDTIGIN
jgi:Subtilase family